MTLFEAVSKVCHDIGVQTSLVELRARVRGLTNKKAPLNALSRLRKQYCQKYGVKKFDCRTYRGQERRNMFSDVKCSYAGLSLVTQICKKLKITASELAEKFALFHSIDHCIIIVEWEERAGYDYMWATLSTFPIRSLPTLYRERVIYERFPSWSFVASLPTKQFFRY